MRLIAITVALTALTGPALTDELPDRWSYSSAALAAAGECVDYNKPITLSGYAALAVFPGRPNHQDTAQGDEDDLAQFLFLSPASTLCTIEDGNGNRGVADLAVVQLGCARDYTKPPGRLVSIKGMLRGADSWWAHAPAILVCDDQ
jgi:hypothetical protein